MKMLPSQIGLAMAVLAAMCGIAMGATVTQSFTYQGTLTNSGGTPLNGNYQMTFNLYDVASGGSSLGTSGPSTVAVTKGQFTTPVTFDSSFFDGRALWLGIKVGADPEMTPRQEIRPVPYALGLRPGAVIKGSPDNTNPTLSLIDSSGGVAALSAITNGDLSTAVSVTTTGKKSKGMDVFSTGDSSYGVKVLTGGQASPALYGESSQDVGVYGKGKEGGYFTTTSAGTSWNDLRPGMNVLATFLGANLNHARSELENPSSTNSYDKVCEIRGEIKATRRVMQYIKKEYDRAAKGDTSEKEKS